MATSINRLVADTFLKIAEGLETGSFAKRPAIAVTGLGSEHGEDNVLEAAISAQQQGVDVHFIGTKVHASLTCHAAKDEEDAHKIMEQLVKDGTVDGAVTMHYPFPIGVSTVGRVLTPGRGRTMYLATTTGTSSTDRVEGMVRNAVAGIISAKACGIAEPTVGIINIDGARQCQAALKKLSDNGYPIKFAESARSDGGSVLRGNDLLSGSADIVVTDPLTGNILCKMLAAYTTGGSYEASGWGYGPGIGENFEDLILIVSRASGAPVIANALVYAGELVRGGWKTICKAEFEAANKAGLATVAQSKKAAPAAETVEVVAPPKEVVTASISGIEVMDLEDAVKVLWGKGIYAESGMGCTGPIVLVSPANLDTAKAALTASGHLGA